MVEVNAAIQKGVTLSEEEGELQSSLKSAQDDGPTLPS